MPREKFYKVGTTVGDVTIVGNYDHVLPSGRKLIGVKYKCNCCGREFEVLKQTMRRNEVTKCHDCQILSNRKAKANAVIGRTFGLLKVNDYAPDKISSNGAHILQVKCECKCGNTRIVPIRQLTTGAVVSCGVCVKPREYRASLTGDDTI